MTIKDPAGMGLKNIGPVSEEWLRAIGIHSREELERIGAIAAYLTIQAHGFEASLNLLYALEAALRDEHRTKLPGDVKARLRAAVSRGKGKA